MRTARDLTHSKINLSLELSDQSLQYRTKSCIFFVGKNQNKVYWSKTVENLRSRVLPQSPPDSDLHPATAPQAHRDHGV